MVPWLVSLTKAPLILHYVTLIYDLPSHTTIYINFVEDIATVS